MPRTTRREFIQSVAAAGVLAQLPWGLTNTHASEQTVQPNFILLFTDQERATQHFPTGWEETNLPNLQRLKKNGVTFNRCFINSSMCTPSRASLFTGIYPAQHGVTDTLPEAEGEALPDLAVLSTEMQNMAKILKSAGYQVYYKGKWHLSYPDGTSWSEQDLQKYGFDGWDPPDAGEDVAPENFGGGRANHDQRYVDDTVAFLKTVDTSKPFCLIVSLVNPHDISSFPGKYETADYPDTMLKGDLELPPTLSENLANNYKPKAHAELVNKLAVGLGPLPTSKRQYEYLNFYGNLLKKVDGQIGQILDVIDAQPALAANTLIFRFADHGEMGLAHGNMRQKMFNVYEETIRVPLVVSNPARYPAPLQSDGLVSLMDILPTLATLAQVPEMNRWDLRGTDFSPIMNGTLTDVQDTVLFTFDDVRAGTEMNPMVSAPNRIRCIREKNWKFARYFDGDGQATQEYEMYDLANDPLEQHNLAHPQHPRYNEPAIAAERTRLEQKLAAVENKKLSPLSTAVRGSNSNNQPEEMILVQNYPNPFNQSTRISVRLPSSGMVNVEILNINGQNVATLTEKIYPAGTHELTWDGNTTSGQQAPTGIYFCRVTLGNFSIRHKLQLIR